MKKIITSILLLASCNSFAADIFYIPFTHHFIEREINGRYNEQNNITGISSDKYTAFAMVNSYDRFSIFAGRKAHYNYGDNLTAFAVVGLMSGYDHVRPSLAGLSLGGYIGIDIHKKDSKFGFVITALPVKQGAINFGFRYSL